MHLLSSNRCAATGIANADRDSKDYNLGNDLTAWSNTCTIHIHLGQSNKTNQRKKQRSKTELNKKDIKNILASITRVKNE